MFVLESFYCQMQKKSNVPFFLYDIYMSSMPWALLSLLVWNCLHNVTGHQNFQCFDFRRPWSWKTGQPTGDVNTCGLVTLGKREVINDAVVTTGGPDDVTRGPTFVFNGVISVEMVACRERRSFVCEKPAIRKNIFPSKFNYFGANLKSSYARNYRMTSVTKTKPIIYRN